MERDLAERAGLGFVGKVRGHPKASVRSTYALQAGLVGGSMRDGFTTGCHAHSHSVALTFA